MVQRFSSCVQFWVIFRITHTEKILNHLKVIRELQCAEVAEPSLGSGGTPGIAREGFLLSFLGRKIRCNADILREI